MAKPIQLDKTDSKYQIQILAEEIAETRNGISYYKMNKEEKFSCNRLAEEIYFDNLFSDREFQEDYMKDK